MPKLVKAPTIVEAAGNKRKTIREYIGRVNSATNGVSIAHMSSPAGWKEPGQRPEFDEYTLVLEGCLTVEHEGGEFEVCAGQAVVASAGEWVRYRTREPTEYVAVCLPAFSPDTVHRDAQGPSATG